MIDTKTEELAALYVLDLLEGDELSAFEERIEQEADVMELVHQLSTALHAPMKKFNGPERMDLLDGIHERIGFAPRNKSNADMDSQKPRHAGILPFSWLQALSAAAALLLVLNVFQYFGTGKEVLLIEDELARSQKSEKALLEENETIKAFNKSWETEYMNLARRMLPLLESRDGLGQFTVIELMAVNQGDGVDNARETGDIAEYFLSRSPLRFASVKMPDIPESSESVTVGYTVWKEDEHRGYLDLYNLAEAAPGRAPFLWVRASARDPFLPVGFLPSLDRGTGTFYFSLDRKNFTPTSILITEESLDGPGGQPSPHHLMVGP